MIPQDPFAARSLAIRSRLAGLDDQRRHIFAFKADVERHAQAVSQSVERVRKLLEAARRASLPS